MNNLTLRKVWIGLGVVLATAAVIQLLRLGSDVWSGAGFSLVLLLGFASALTVSALKQNTSKSAHRLFLVCLGVTVVYSLSFVMMVGWEFGVAWLAIDLVAFFFALFSIFKLRT